MKIETKLQPSDFCYEVTWNGGSKLFTSYDAAEATFEYLAEKRLEPSLCYNGPDGFKELK